jgi:hypothetical protein
MIRSGVSRQHFGQRGGDQFPGAADTALMRLIAGVPPSRESSSLPSVPEGVLQQSLPVSGDRNIQLLRRFHDDMWVRRDLEAALKCASPQLQIDWSASTAPYSGTYVGPQGLADFCHAFWDTWDGFNPAIDEFVVCGPERLITVHRVSARGRTSGIEVASGGAVLWTIREETVLRGKLFQSRGEALKAAEAGG